ncbi:MAG: hypothetical protein NTZ26_13590 [Candidatus Aminicenantes bacterium]|nr:hypothetical protein [Candidatus Aminicenantes bacterium]
MKRILKIVSLMLMVAWLASFAAAQKPMVQTAGTGTQLVLGAQDVITASDAGGGYLTSGDILIIILIILALIGLGVLVV